MNQNNSDELKKVFIQLFHNILNPITVLSLEIDNQQSKTLILQTEINSVIYHITKLEYFVSSLSENFSPFLFIKKFSVNEEIEQLLEITSYLAKQTHVHISSLLLHEVYLHGNQMKFHQSLIQIFELLLFDRDKESKPLFEKKEKKIEITLEKKRDEFLLIFSFENINFDKEKIEKFQIIEQTLHNDFFMKSTLHKNQKISLVFQSKPKQKL